MRAVVAVGVCAVWLEIGLGKELAVAAFDAPL